MAPPGVLRHSKSSVRHAPLIKRTYKLTRQAPSFDRTIHVRLPQKEPRFAPQGHDGQRGETSVHQPDRVANGCMHQAGAFWRASPSWQRCALTFALHDHAVVVRLTMSCKVEDVVLNLAATVEVRFSAYQLVTQS